MIKIVLDSVLVILQDFLIENVIDVGREVGSKMP
jgi:hypothetical protein